MTALHGHEAAIATFREGLASGRLHHAWLISGPQGIGKGLFARAAARRMLADAAGPISSEPALGVESGHPAARLFDAGSHPDYRLIEREVWDAKGNIVPKSERSGNEELSRNVRIKQIRALAASLGMRPSMSSRRAVVIDAADDLERSAANALLKNLEEPPPGTVFFLVSHATEKLLPTIRSRCRQLRLSSLDDAAMASALKAALPDADAEEIAVLKEAGAGAPGRAIAFRGLDIGTLDQAMQELVRRGDPANGRRSKLAAALALKAAQPRYEAFLARAPSIIAAVARERTGPALGEALRLYERAADLAGSATRLSLDPQSVVFEIAGMLAALAPQSREEGKRAFS